MKAGTEAQRKQHAEDSKLKRQTPRPRQAPQSPATARRVGGGYDILLASSHDVAAAAEAAASAGKLLQGLEGPLTEQDLLVIRHILKTAEAAAVIECQSGHASSSNITLAKLLQAYEAVLPQHGLLPQEDTHFYRILLKLTLDPDHDWWSRFHKERKQWNRRVQAVAATATNTKRSPTARLPPAAAKWHSATSSKARSRPAAPGASARKAAAGPAPAAVHAAAVAVDAATAAVAAAWADARVRSRSSSAAARLPPRASDAGVCAGPQQSFSLESWQRLKAEPSACCTWMTGCDTVLSGHDTALSEAAAAAVEAAAAAVEAAAHSNACRMCSPGSVAAPSAAAAVEHTCSCWHSSPVQLRAASAASVRSSCCEELLAGCQQQVQLQAVRRSRSTSPYMGLRQSSSSCLPMGAARPSSSGSGIVHEYPCAGCSGGVCSCMSNASNRVSLAAASSAARRSSSPAAGEALSQAVLAAGQRDRLWKCLELHSSAAAKIAAQQQQQRCGRSSKHQQGAGLAAEAVLQQEVSEDTLQPHRYANFVAFMAVQHNWRGRALSSQTSRNALAAAEGLWLLAMSFWEVHAAWRCFVKWQQLAVTAAKVSNRQHKHGLLVCTFNWWRRMTQHYLRQQQAAGGHAARSTLQPPQQADSSRPGSPLTGLVRVLQQHPSLRPPCSPAGEMRQQACGRVLAAYAFAAWLVAAHRKAEQKQLQETLTWHHVQHVQASVWRTWRAAFEKLNPQHRLMTVVYRARRHSMLSKVLRRWGVWAPLKHAQRRRLRDAVTALHSSKRRRVWGYLRDYTATPRVKGAARRRAQQHFRQTCLVKCLAYWLHGLEIAAAFEELADSCWSKLLQRHSQAMLQWWRQWVVHKQQQQELLESSCCHMEAYSVQRVVAAWQGCVLRRQQLQDVLQRGLAMSERMAATAAFRGWHTRTEERKRHARIAQVVSNACRQRRVVAVWICWLEYVARRQQQQQDLQQLTQRNQLFVWRTHLMAWQALLQQKFMLWEAVATLQRNTAKRCALHWKAWVDKKADWRSFQARATQRMTRVRLVIVLRLWRACAYQQSLLRELLAGLLQRQQLRRQQAAFTWWRAHLMARVAKRMNELSALVQWEQSITRRALRVWLCRTAVWRFKRQQRLRANSYRALRLLDLALTSWSSLWAEGQEFSQKAAFLLAGRQSELQVLVLRAWGPEAARLRLKREHLEIARLHSVVSRQQQVVTGWHAEAARRLRLRELLGAAVSRWSQQTLSMAFQQWKDWALHQASLQRRMRAVVSMMMGRTLHWAFCMMREHALRKRRSRSARHHWQRHVAVAALSAWRQLAADAASFRGVLYSVGRHMRLGLLSEAFLGWRDVIRAKQWKEANMMRALMLWGGNRRQLCFQAWRQWVQLKQGKKKSLRHALHHWQHSYMARALGFWQYYTKRQQVARHVLRHFRTRYLAAAFDAWRCWYQRKSYLAAVFAKLQGKGNHQVIRIVWNAWRSFVPQIQDKRQAKGRAAAHWQRRALILSFAWWHEYAAAISSQRQQLADALMCWDTRRLSLALEGWHTLTRRKQRRQEQFVQGLSRKRWLVLSSCFRGWREQAQLQLYRRHVVRVVGHKVNNGLLLKTFNCWRDMAESKQACRQQLATALTSWWLNMQRNAFYMWMDNTRDAVMTREALAHWQRSCSSRFLAAWREHVLVRQQYSIITRVVTNKRVSRLLLEAWTAWREVVDLRHQVTGRLRGVAQGWDLDKLILSLDTWRQWALLKHLKRLAMERWVTKQKARCWAAWRLWADRRRADAGRVTVFRTTGAKRLAAAVLREWRVLAWLLPREQRAEGFAALWLQRRGVWGWRQWLQQRHRWQQLGDSLAASWTNLHLVAAWQAWRAWVQGRQEKARMAASVAKRWNNLHLTAAFQAWSELVQVAHRHKAAVLTIAGRWRNLHTAAAFGAWRSFVAQHKQHRSAAAAVAARWQNLHLATAFGCWRQSVAEAAERAAAADHLLARVAAATLAAAFFEWHEVAARKAHLRKQGVVVAGRQQRLYMELAYGGWKEAVQWRASKRAADAHWRQVVLRSVLVLWFRHAQQQAGYQKTAAVVRGRTHQQLLRRSMISWQLFVKHRRQQATAEAYAASKLQQQVFLAWAQEACHARCKATAAVNMAARVQARVHNQLLFQCFAAWRTRVARASAIKGVVLGFSTKRLRTYLRAWQQQAHMLAGAAHLLRRLLAVTTRGAFQEWRTVARERAHWHRVEHHLITYLRMDDTGAAARAIRAVQHWCNPTLWAAFATWRQAAVEHVRESTNELKASKFLQLALVLKALTGFKWAVQEAKVDTAAAQHRGGAMKKAVLRGWRQVACYLQEKRQKDVAAGYAWSVKTKHKALSALLAYSQFRVKRAQQTIAARHHCALRRKARILAAWRGLARYLVPIRRALHVMTSRRHHRSTRQIFASWRLVCLRSALLRMALGRLQERTLSAAFVAWKYVASMKHKRRSLLNLAVSRLSHLLLARAFTRWVEAAQELKALRAKAQQVLRNTLQRRMRSALAVWLGYVAHREAKRAMMAVAERQWRRVYAKHSMVAWAAFVKEARRFAALSEQMLMRRQKKQRRKMLHWWHLIAQDLHHHRTVLKSFRARHVRQEGQAAFRLWREWAHWRAMERRAIVAHWHKLMLLAFATWKLHHEDLQFEKAVAHDSKRHTGRALAAWQLGLAVVHRKRSLVAASDKLCMRHRLQHSVWLWMRYTYYKHMGHVALHFRVRRLGCIVMREWNEAACVRVVERETAQLLTHQLAVNCVTRVLTGWQQLLRAHTHWRQHTLQGCWAYWAYWAPAHKARNAGWRSAAEVLAARKLGRCFYCWRWYCQVRLLREVAFQNKQRAIREALEVGEQVARRRKVALLASSFMAWHIQVSKYSQVAQKLASLLHRNLASCIRSWREATDQARVMMLRAQRQHTTRTLSRLLPAWQEAAADAREQREAAEETADKHWRRQLLAGACVCWQEEVQVVAEQRQGLWRLMLMLLGHERRQLLQAASEEWRVWVQDRVSRRACIAAFVNKRRVACLGEYLTLWQQYAAAMRGAQGEEAAAATMLLQQALTPPARSHSPRSPLSPDAGYYTWPGAGHGSSSSPQRHAAGSSSHNPGAAVMPAAPAGGVGCAGAPAGVLPVTGGPSSPLLGPRSAHLDRRLARRWAAMGGGAAEVDAGSDDEQQILEGLPAIEASVSAAERHARQQPLLALCRGYRQRRVTLGDDRRQYDDEAEAVAGGVTSPRWDLHSVAESMQQAHEQGLSPWQLPSVRTSPPPKQPQPNSLSLEQLRSYQQHYPYSLEQQWQQQSIKQLQEQEAQQQLLHASHQQPLGRPASAGTRADYQPLLQQHLALQETLRQQQQQQPLPWHQHSSASPPQQHGHHQQVLPTLIAAEPWHSGKPRWQSSAAAAAATGVWGDRRTAGRSVLIPAASSRSSSPSSSQSTISAVAGSVHAFEDTQQPQRQSVDLHRCQKWADKAGKTAATAGGGAAVAAQSPPGAWLSSAGGQQRRKLPSYNGQVLPWEFAALV